jgi:hypothetical protein
MKRCGICGNSGWRSFGSDGVSACECDSDPGLLARCFTLLTFLLVLQGRDAAYWKPAQA